MIDVIKVKNREEGQTKAHDLLKKIVDGETLLALSGGTSVDYKTMLVNPDDVIPGAITIVDERYGEPFHRDSNELLLKNFGIKDWADEHCIESHKYLKGKSFLETAKLYEKEMEQLLGRFKKKIGVMGVGTNLHTAGIFPYSVAAKSPNFVEAETVEDKQSLRSSTSSAGLEFPKRLTLTLRALGEFTSFVILMFGESKKNAMKTMLDDVENDMQKYPAIFYRKSKIPSYLVTDQVLN